MSDEQPRMTRREMRAKGLLAPVLDGTSTFEEFTPTAEIRLKRLTRKEMRERERAAALEAAAKEGAEGTDAAKPEAPSEASSQAAFAEVLGGGAPVDAGEGAAGAGEAAAEAVEAAAEGVQDIAEETSETAADEAAEVTEAAAEAVDIVGAPEAESDEAKDSEDSAADEELDEAAAAVAGWGASRSSVFARFEEDDDESEPAAEEAEGETPQAEQANDTLTEGLEAVAEEVAEAEEGPVEDHASPALSDYDAEMGELVEDEKPRNWLMLIVSIIIGAVVGIGIGMLIREAISFGDVSPTLDAMGTLRDLGR